MKNDITDSSEQTSNGTSINGEDSLDTKSTTHPSIRDDFNEAAFLSEEDQLRGLIEAVRSILSLKDWNINLKQSPVQPIKTDQTAEWFVHGEPEKLTAMIEIVSVPSFEMTKLAVCCAVAELSLTPLFLLASDLINHDKEEYEMDTRLNAILRREYKQTAIRIGRGMYSLFSQGTR